MLLKKELKLGHSPFSKKATVYCDTNAKPKACILYFHGGGLLYGQRSDLPALHLHHLTQAGYVIIAFDYPLAPNAKLDMILDDVCASINHYIESSEFYTDTALPFFLWGRSAGAYLCLLAAASGKCTASPKGILSYYGYGFLCDNWFNTPSSYYQSLPLVDKSCLEKMPDKIQTSGDLGTCYSLYVYARQSGRWAELIYSGREKFFYLDYSLRTCESLPYPLFCAHSTNDPDVPYSEFLELCSRYGAQRFITPGDVHDFDRNENDPAAREVLDASVHFLDSCL